VSPLMRTKTPTAAVAAAPLVCALTVGVALGNLDFDALRRLVCSWLEMSAGPLHTAAWLVCVVVLSFRRGYGAP
jgi:hypothetical protein